MAVSELPQSVAHPFYENGNRLLAEHGFDEFVETQCRLFYAERMGRPSLAPGQYFCLLSLGYFEGLDSERARAWGVADPLGMRAFLGLTLTAAAPDHSTLSRTRRWIDAERRRAVFTWILKRLTESRLGQRQNDRDRRHHARSQHGAAQHRVLRRRGEL
jgi:transposase